MMRFVLLASLLLLSACPPPKPPVTAVDLTVEAPLCTVVVDVSGEDACDGILAGNHPDVSDYHAEMDVFQHRWVNEKRKRLGTLLDRADTYASMGKAASGQ